MFRELTPPETYAELAAEDDAILVDCRSPAEWHFTGMPDLSALGKKVVLAAVADEGGRPNPHFIDEIKAASRPMPFTVIADIMTAVIPGPVAVLEVCQNAPYHNHETNTTDQRGLQDGGGPVPFLHGWRHAGCQRSDRSRAESTFRGSPAHRKQRQG